MSSGFTAGAREGDRPPCRARSDRKVVETRAPPPQGPQGLEPAARPIRLGRDQSRETRAEGTGD